MGNIFEIGIKHDVTSISSTYPGQSVDNWYFWISILSASLSPHKACHNFPNFSQIFLQVLQILLES